MTEKKDAYNLLMTQVLAFIDRFKFIDKAIDNLCRRLGKSAIKGEEFSEVLKLYNTTGHMYTKSLELLDSIICRFPEELTPDELELISHYRELSESEKFIYKSRLKKRL